VTRPSANHPPGAKDLKRSEYVVAPTNSPHVSGGRYLLRDCPRCLFGYRFGCRERQLPTLEPHQTAAPIAPTAKSTAPATVDQARFMMLRLAIVDLLTKPSNSEYLKLRPLKTSLAYEDAVAADNDARSLPESGLRNAFSRSALDSK
jgi:hypothetical protein